MPRRNRNALRGGPKLARDVQPALTADGFDDLDHLIVRAQRSVVAKLDAATDFSAVLVGICANAAVMDGGRR
jgi:hypothetical protein